MRAPRLLYFNPLFDLELGGVDTRRLRGSAAEMGPLFALVGTREDLVVLDVHTHEEYGSYLRSCGIESANPLPVGQSCAEGARAVPWGWNEHALARLKSLGSMCEHPPLEVVRQVNSRTFGASFLSRMVLGVPQATTVRSSSELDEALRNWTVFPAVAKPSYGNAGYGFIHLTSATIDERTQARLCFLAETQGLTLEPWLDKTCDLSSRCFIEPNGHLRDISHHQCHTNAAGAFFGVLLDPANSHIHSHEAILNDACVRVARVLYSLGYYGPLGLDSFLYRDGSGTERCAAAIDINARYSMSSILYALRKKLSLEIPLYFRLIARRRHRLPQTYTDLAKALGPDMFDPRTRRGILLLNPLRVLFAGAWRRPQRSAFLLAADTVGELMAMDSRLREALR